tara:strand:+ start:212 stop:388 length:177 start_codon:yes stop_codon:yes gene_type:complete
MDTNEKSEGLGDTVEKFTKATGIKKIIQKIAEKTGRSCGCEARRKKLNSMFPYGRKNK